MLASIIIPSYGKRLDYLKDTVISVQNQEFPDDEYEIIVIDNSPDANISSIVDCANQNNNRCIQYIREKKMGLIHARHCGARQAKGDLLIYVDDDIIASPTWLKAIVKPFENPDVGCVGGKVLPQWEAERPSWLSQFNSGYLSLLDLGDKTIELKKTNIWGCNMAVRKNLLFALGGFHPDGIGDRNQIWFRGNGECGLEKKIYNIGFKLIYEPKAMLYHRISASRLTLKHFNWRLFKQGIDDSYVYIRDMRMHNKHFFYIRIMKEIVLCYIRAGKAYFNSVIKKDKKIRLKADVWYWNGKSQHLIRTLISKKLRQHIFRHSYL